VVDADGSYLLWTALHWAAAAVHQAERARASFEPYRGVILSRTDGEIVRMTPEMERPKAIFWADVHFLMIAMKHLDGVLKMLGPVMGRKVIAGTPHLRRCGGPMRTSEPLDNATGQPSRGKPLDKPPDSTGQSAISPCQSHWTATGHGKADGHWTLPPLFK
jgi:hypothetical protein